MDGSGPLDSPLMVVGEAPAFEDDRSGNPFAGGSGKLLRTTLQSIAARLYIPPKEFKVFYTNSVRCRPPGNRDPEQNELDSCRPWLVEEIDTIRPRVILTVGLAAGTQVGVAMLHPDIDQMWLLRARVVEAFHPAYVLQHRRKTKEWEAQLEEAVRATYPELVHIPRQESLVMEPWGLGGAIDRSSQWLSADTETDDLEEGVGVRRVGWSLSDGSAAMFTTDDPDIVGYGDWHDGGWGPHPHRIYTRAPHIYLHNAKYDLPLLDINPWDFARWDDTMLMAYVLRKWDRLSLKELAPELTGVRWKYKITELLRERVRTTRVLKNGKEKVTEKWVKVPFSRALEVRPDDCIEYAATDALATARLAKVLEAEFEQAPWARRYYHELVKPLVPVLLGMETRGILVDPDAIRAAEVPILEARTLAEEAFRTRLNYAGNIRSGPQLGPVLLEAGIVDGRKTETGAIGTDKAAILAAFHVEKPDQLPDTESGRAAAALLEFKAMDKLKSTYVDALLAARDSEGRIHARFNQGPDTGRLSSSDPNLQNIPVRTKAGAAIRKAFIARPGYVLVVGDYSQLEPRIFGELTHDPMFLAAYAGPEEKDVYQLYATDFGLVRSDTKNAIMAALFGGEESKIASLAKVPAGQASAFLSQLRERAPAIVTWRKDIAASLAADGYVETLQGWRCMNPLFWSPVRREQQDALRSLASCPIQGSGAGVVRRLMLTSHTELAVPFGLAEMNGPGLELQVHDELVWEVPEERAEHFAGRFEELGKQVGRIDCRTVPLRLDVKIVTRWGDAK